MTGPERSRVTGQVVTDTRQQRIGRKARLYSPSAHGDFDHCWCPLMLTIAERLAAREGLDWVFCDTDSIALVKPEGMSDDEFNRKADAVQQWFVPLNPYDFGGPLLQTEKHNYGLHKGKPTRDLEAHTVCDFIEALCPVQHRR